MFNMKTSDILKFQMTCDHCNITHNYCSTNDCCKNFSFYFYLNTYIIIYATNEISFSIYVYQDKVIINKYYNRYSIHNSYKIDINKINNMKISEFIKYFDKLENIQ